METRVDYLIMLHVHVKLASTCFIRAIFDSVLKVVCTSFGFANYHRLHTRSKTKTNHDLLARLFPCLMLVACFCYKF